MDKVKLNFLLLLHVFFLNSILSSQNDSCPYIHSGTYGVEWPNTTTKTLSRPPCVGENMEFLYRNCNKGMWSDEPNCLYVQSPSDCPDNFVSISDYCYTIIQATSYPPKCPYPNILSFKTYQKFFTNTKPFWMPVFRNTSYSLGFLQWMEPSELYKTEYKNLQTVQNRTMLNKNCLVYYNSSYIAVESCENQHSAICAYKKITKLQTNLCDDNCYLNDITADANCICIANISEVDQEYDKAEFAKPYQVIVYKLLNNRVCTIGLERISNGSYIWTSLQEKINYTFWSEDVVFGETHIYGALTSKGWILTETILDCVLLEKIIDQPKPIGNLTFDSVNNELILTISNPRRINLVNGSYLIFCFTDAHYTQLLYRYPFPFQTEIQENLLIVQFTPLVYGPGNYWCEYSAYPDYFTSTDVVFVNASIKWGSEFVGIFSVEYNVGTNPLGSTITQFLDTLLFQGFTNLEPCCISRIMKVIALDESTRTVQANVHFTAKPQNSTEKEQYDVLYNKIQNSFSPISKDLKIELLALRSPNFCVSESYKNVTWPQTPRGQKTVSEEFCFDALGQRPERKCEGNFMDGASWLPADDCEIMDFSSITQQLIYTASNQSSDTCIQVLNLTEDFDLLCMLDIYLIGDILWQWFEKFPIDIECVVQIINNLLYIKKSILVEAEEEMLASNLFLSIINNIMHNETSNAVHVTRNFAFVSYLIKDFFGLVVTKQGSEYTISELDSETTLEDIEKILYIENALVLNSKFQKQFNDTDRITVCVFFNNSFFTQFNNEFRNTSLIFGVVLPDTEFALEEPIQIINRHEMNKSQNMDHVCSFWNQDFSSKGYWVEDSKSDSSSNFQVCSYFAQHPYLALVFGPKSFFENNITIQLLELYELDNFYSSTLFSLESISEYYKEFLSLDVFLVGKILEQYNLVPTLTDLESLATIINNLQKISPDILTASQVDHGATDTILQHLDSILQTFPQEVTLIRDSFAVVIYNLDVHNISGIALIEENTTMHVQVLDNKYDFTQITSLKNLQSAIWLNESFRRTSTENQNLIITVFTTNAFFSDYKLTTTKNLKLSIIFGLHLPQTNLTRSIVMINKAVAGHQQDCVNWNFSQLDSDRGHWKKDETMTTGATYVQCEFVGSSHFAFLIHPNKFYQPTILDWVTDIFCGISIFGLCIIILTSILFKKWRMNPGNQILLNFCAALLFYIITFDISCTFTQIPIEWCTIFGALLHYTKLAQQCWMLIIAMLQIKRFVFVLEGPPQYVLIKSCIFAWGFPIIPMTFVLIFDPQSYVAYNDDGVCFASGLSLFLAVWLPCVIIIFLNCIIFVFILYNVVFKSRNNNECVKSDTILHIRLAIFLFFVLGLNWLFAVLASFNFGDIFYDVFFVSTSIQGFVIFLFFIIFNKDTRKLYRDLFHRCCSRRTV